MALLTKTGRAQIALQVTAELNVSDTEYFLVTCCKTGLTE
jgi:hypothetical protein